MALDMTSYAAAQRQRLEEIRRAADKERQLLALHTVRLVPTIEKERLEEKEIYTVIPDGGRWNFLNDKAMELHTLDEKLTLEEREVEQQTFKIDRRLRGAEQRKKELLSQLALLQHREVTIKKQEEQLEEDESTSERESRLLETQVQEMNEEQLSMDTRINEKRGRLNTAKITAREQQKKRETLEMRSRLQIDEIQDRIREHRMELMKCNSSLNDKERLLRQEQSRIREEELSSIYRLKKEIELIEISLTSKGVGP